MARSVSSLFRAIGGLSRFFKFSELTWNGAPLVEQSPVFPWYGVPFVERSPIFPWSGASFLGGASFPIAKRSSNTKRSAIPMLSCKPQP